MNVLCSDKTGTLTEGVVRLHSALDVDGPGEREGPALRLPQRLLRDRLSQPDRRGHPRPTGRFDLSGYQKLDEVPYDFVRKRLSILVAKDDAAPDDHQGRAGATCSRSAPRRRRAGGSRGRHDRPRSGTEIDGAATDALSRQGLRVLGVAYRDLGSAAAIAKDDEADMTFLGFLVFFDPPKAGIGDTIGRASGAWA